MRFLVLALVFACAAAPQATRPFSHRIHLKLRPDCNACHTAARTSTKVTDNLLPDRKVCLECHKDVSIPSPPATRVTRFDHAKHLKMGNIAPVIAAAIDSGKYLGRGDGIRKYLNTGNQCAACHRGMEESDRVTRAAMPQMADCLVCHDQIQPPDSCVLCHAGDTNLKPANHTPDFVDTHTTGKAGLDKSTCAVCHGRNFTCMGCH